MSRGPIPDKPRQRPTVPEVKRLIAAYYAKPGNSVGGSLHIVLDDQNLDDRQIRWCLNEAAAHEDGDGVRLAKLLLQMTKTQRKRATC